MKVNSPPTIWKDDDSTPMSPDPGQRKAAKKTKKSKEDLGPIKTTPSSEDEHLIAYFQRHIDDDPDRASPGRDFLKSCPGAVRAKMDATLVAVATAPPKRFSGGGRWEAMHGDMSGWFELRIDGPKRHHYRLYCLLDYEAVGLDKPLLVVIDGRSKPFKTTLTEADYQEVRALGDEYRKHNPRSII